MPVRRCILGSDLLASPPGRLPASARDTRLIHPPLLVRGRVCIPMVLLPPSAALGLVLALLTATDVAVLVLVWA